MGAYTVIFFLSLLIVATVITISSQSNGLDLFSRFLKRLTITNLFQTTFLNSTKSFQKQL